MKVIAICQQKGGTGKTTTAHALGAGIARTGGKVLYVDLDPQANLTYTLRGSQAAEGTRELLTRRRQASQVIQHAEGGDLIGASQFLATADMELATAKGREYRLAHALGGVIGTYTHIIIDTPPALGTLSINALTAADDIILPCLADVYSIQATQQLAAIVQTTRERSNSRLRIAGILITHHRSRRILDSSIIEGMEAAAKEIETRVFATKIRENIAIREAQAKRMDIYTYAPKSNGAKDYTQLVEEYLAR